MIPSVTGQDTTSDLSIAERFAALKSDHMPGAPVRSTTVLLVERAWSLPLSVSAAATIAFGSRAAPPCTIAVCPSGETVTPGVGGTTTLTARFERSVLCTRATTALKPGCETVSRGE